MSDKKNIFSILVKKDILPLDIMSNYKTLSNGDYVELHYPSDSYEIGENGTLSFFNKLKLNDKVFKSPILSIANGNWISCALIQSVPQVMTQKTEVSATYQNSNQIEPVTNVIPKQGTSDLPQEQNAQQPTTTNIEKHIIDFCLEEEFFIPKKFIAKMDEIGIEVKESDMSWAIISLLKNRKVVPTKFSTREKQKLLQNHAPGIMKRHWDGTMAPILSILQDREETKTISQIDLAAWLTLNDYI